MSLKAMAKPAALDPGPLVTFVRSYVQGRGALKRELVACLRTGRALRVPRARIRGRGKKFVTPEIMISERPAEAADRTVLTTGRATSSSA